MFASVPCSILWVEKTRKNRWRHLDRGRKLCYYMTERINPVIKLRGVRVAFTEEQNEIISRDLIRQARQCGVTIGMRKTSVEQLADAVGISKGSFYKFFASKELLFFAVLEDIHTEGFEAANRALRENADLPPAERTAAAVLAVNGDGTLLLQAGKMKMTVKAAQVRLLETAEEIEEKKKQAAKSRAANGGGTVQINTGARASAELDIRGLETLEAESVVEN